MPDYAAVLSAYLANVVVESFLYGVFLVLDIGSIIFIYFPLNNVTKKGSNFRRAQVAVKKPMFLGAIALFVTITGHWICTVLRLFRAVVYSETGPLMYYVDVSQDLYIIKLGFVGASLIIGDSMLIYRLWAIWARNYYVIIIPVLALIGLIVCGVSLTRNYAQYTPEQIPFSPVMGAWVFGFMTFTMLTNVYSSILIGYQIWRMRPQSPRYAGAIRVGSNNLSSALIVFIESTMLYTFWTTAFIANYAVLGVGTVIIADCWAVIAGISFSFINVRIRLGWARNPSAMPSTTPTRRQHHSAANMRGTSFALPMQPLTVHIHQVKDTLPTDSIGFPGVGGFDSSVQKDESRASQDGIHA
ncbi:hypothetical protein WG66_009421 [Moniliophthora roreri]|uniref:Uncharacterized protein n=1 Tax=Moniliophthora roreri TaxID=221103 RepID=A0A0W0FPI1_MONRR|nr:hypothetical protein WG66_009421 [Moniliophthora roreri]